MTSILKSRKLRYFIALFSLFLLFDMIQDSYAKYVSSAEAYNDITIAKWSFKVNSQDVLDESDFSETIMPVFEGSSYIAPGVIAPTSEGYFDIEIDSTDTDVNYIETITLSKANENTISDLKIIGYKLNDGEFVEFTDNTVISTTKRYDSIQKINKYRVYVKWMDGEGEIMDNADDTTASKNGVASIAITINFIQTTSLGSE